MSKQSWEAIKGPKDQYSLTFYVQVKDEPDLVAEVYDLEGDGGESAARLIAAAPEMLKALEAILDASEDPARIEAIAHTAIDKARRLV